MNVSITFQLGIVESFDALVISSKLVLVIILYYWTICLGSGSDTNLCCEFLAVVKD